MNILIHHYVNIAQEGINGNQRKKKYHSRYYDLYPKKEKKHVSHYLYAANI